MTTRWKWEGDGHEKTVESIAYCCYCLVVKPCHKDFPDKNIEAGCHFFCQWIFLTQGRTQISHIGRQVLFHWATKEDQFLKGNRFLKVGILSMSIDNAQERKFATIFRGGILLSKVMGGWDWVEKQRFLEVIKSRKWQDGMLNWPFTWTINSGRTMTVVQQEEKQWAQWAKLLGTSEPLCGAISSARTQLLGQHLPHGNWIQYCITSALKSA